MAGVSKEHLYFVEIAKRRGLVGTAAIQVALARAESDKKHPRDVLDLEPADKQAIAAELATLAFTCPKCQKPDFRAPGSTTTTAACEECAGFVSKAKSAPGASSLELKPPESAPAWQTSAPVRKTTGERPVVASGVISSGSLSGAQTSVGPSAFASSADVRPAPAAPVVSSASAPAASTAAKTGEAIATGQVIGGCRITQKLGEGGMGRVYRARHLGFDRDVALKVLDEKLVARPGFIEQFTAEARVLFGLDHPNVVRVFNVDKTESGTHFLVMELLEGQSVHDLWVKRQKKLPVNEAIRLVVDAARGLHHAHTKKLLHRDVKPANLMLNAEGKVKVVDFGLAVPTENELFVATAIAGTPHYMAPEQADGLKLDARCDQYALGITLYQLLCGRVPFERKKLSEILFAHMSEPPPRPRDLRPELPEWLEGVVLRMLEKAPVSRFPSLAEAVAALEAGAQGPDSALAPRAPAVSVPRIRLDQIAALEKGKAPKPLRTPSWRPAAAIAAASLVAAVVFVAIPAREAFGRSGDLGRDEVPTVVRDLERDVQTATRTDSGEELIRALARVAEAAQDLGSRPGAGRLDALQTELKKRVEDVALRRRTEITTQANALASQKRFGPAIEALAPSAELEALGLSKWASEERAKLAAALLAAQGEVYVPRGTFASGEAGRTKPVLVPGFYLDATEVTNDAWAKSGLDRSGGASLDRSGGASLDRSGGASLDRSGGASLDRSGGASLDPALAKRPVTLVSFEEAQAFATARKKRLPTSIEWEKAARGDRDERAYPWGPTFEPRRANVLDGGSGALEDVGARAGDVSPCGAHDLAGNALEWVTSPEGPLVAGGGFLSSPTSARVNARLALDPGTRHPAVGFRCARDLERD